MKITDKYRTIGVQQYYQDPETQETYVNPHAQFIQECVQEAFYQYFTEDATVLDLACGNGLISTVLKSCGVSNIEGSDKYMFERYSEETSLNCYPYSFEDIADFNCQFNQYYDVIICSYAFDIVPESYRNKMLYALSTYTDKLILIRPNSHELDSELWELVHKNKVQKSTATVYTKKERHS